MQQDVSSGHDAAPSRHATAGSATVVVGGIVHTADPRGSVYGGGSVLVVGDRIAAVGDDSDVQAAIEDLAPGLRAELRTIDAGGRLVLPGFVNPHWHEGFAGRFQEALRPLRDDADTRSPFAAGGDIHALSQLFDRAYSLHELIQDDEAVAIARYSLWTQLRCGTTTLGDVGSTNRPEAILAAADTSGMRAAVSVWGSDGMLDPGTPGFIRTRDADDVLTRIEAVVAAGAADTTGRIRAMPSVVYTSNASDELCRGIVRLAEQHDTPIATHVGALERESEVIVHHFGLRPIPRFDALGLVSDRLVAVHCAFADAAEQRRLLDERVHVSHAPAKYGTTGESQLSRTGLILDLYRQGLDVSVSTDGESTFLGGMPEAMRQAWLAHNEIASDNTAIRPSDTLAMATRLPARGLRWEDQIGSLEVGKQADLVLVDVSDWRYVLAARPLETFLRVGGSNDVETVMVAGEILVEDGHSTRVDESDLRTGFVRAVRAIGERSGLVDPEAFDRLAASVPS